MATGSRPRKADARYFFTFAGTATLLVASTLVLVLYVLPQRYVLSSGFVEGSMNFPDPAVPFEPLAPRLVAAVQPPAVDETIPRGPAEAFWEAVLPLLEAERWDDAIGLFALYLGEYPNDRGVRREYALTLVKAGHPDRAIPLFEYLLSQGEDVELRLIFARTLRDSGRVAEAQEQYLRLLGLSPNDVGLRLEAVRALAWDESYEEAIALLREGLQRAPNSLALRAELARVFYYAGQVDRAFAVLSGMSDAERRESHTAELWSTILGELTPPAVEPLPEIEPTPLELALRARDEGRLEEAARLFAAALAGDPDDPTLWLEYANLLQYERNDLVGALEALARIEALTGPPDTALQYRMAQLEVWTDDLPAAENRLTMLVDVMSAGAGPGADGDPSMADVLALLGDVLRWRADRPSAASRYAMALEEDPNHPGALSGIAALSATTRSVMIESETPRIGALVRSFADTDNFRRLDLGGEWRGIDGTWVWGTRSGIRLLQGADQTASTGELSGLFAELEGGRWWRSGTLRTALRAGVQAVRSNEVDLAVGASLRRAAGDGARTDVDVDHRPAHLSANTLQSVTADVHEDRLAVGHVRPLSPRWTLSLSGEAASISHSGVPAADRNTRAGASAALGRSLGGGLSAGVAVRGLTYADAAPVSGGLGLYWDPEWSAAIGPFVQWQADLPARWRVEARATPGVGLLRERAAVESEFVPDLSGTLRAVREGSQYRTVVELLYGQGRFTGYRSFGLNLAFSARGWTGGGS